MKKLLAMMVLSLCGTIGYAQSDVISLNDVTILPGGTKQMEVKISNPSTYTAFQFDLTLPKGISVKEASMNGTYSDRKLEKGLIDEAANKYRFLSYDMNNANLTEDAVVATITLEATEDAESATLTGSDLLVVTSDGTSTPQETASAKISVVSDVIVKISAAKQAILCSDKNLDFSKVSDVKAYIVTGHDKVSGKIYLSRVEDVPAGTAMLLMGEEGEYSIPELTESKNIYKNMLVGSLTGTTVNKDSGDGMTNYILSSKDGVVGFYFAKESGSTIKAGGGYLPLPTTITAVGTAGGEEQIDMNKYGMLCYYTDESLDFTNVEDLKAYTATGYDKKGTIRLTRVKQVPAETAVLLLGPEEKKTYTVPTASLQQIYSNMFVGTLEGTTIYKEESGLVNYYISVVDEVVGFYWASESGTKIPAKRGWLPVPKEMVSLASTRANDSVKEKLLTESTDDIITMNIYGGYADEDGSLTGISRVNLEEGIDDTWYNLNGQRIDTPNRKGLFIKNGKKVIVK